MNYIDKVYIDLDGIIVNCIGHIIKTLGKDSDEFYKNWVAGEYDICKPLGLTQKELNNSLDESFWLSAELTEEADLIMELLMSQFGRRNLAFLTSPIEGKNCIDSKISWSRKHYPKLSVIVTTEKYMIASPNKLLIDDYDLNVAQFIEHGGNAILYPRYWNSDHLRRHDGFKILKQRIKNFCFIGRKA